MPDIYSGYRRFDVNKLFQAMKFFCFNDRVYKTKLMKLLFYADFKHFKEQGVSITGVHYAHATHGPVPDHFETWLVAITQWESQITSEEKVSGDYVGDVFYSDQPDLSLFSNSELASLASIKQQFEEFTSRDIRDYSHEEKGYLETKDGELISYKFAEELRI